jgi:hypothetical protein
MDHPVRAVTSEAFELAYFIHPDRTIALGIIQSAWSVLDARLRPQRKRFYYVLRGRIASGTAVRARTKITLEESQKLQSLIYLESEKVERQQETTLGQPKATSYPGSGGISKTSASLTNNLIPRIPSRETPCLTEEDWLIRFIKHLVAITVTRSSFYVTLGISRTVFNYATDDSIKIYDAVIQDTNRMKDAPYFRKRKNEVLMKELKERFGALLRTRIVAHGEERFACRADSERFAGLVKQCLELFTPWNTSCALPARLDLMNEPIASLLFEDDNPDKEHAVEARRMHTIIHPACFERLTAALQLPSLATRLEIPMFFSNQTESHQSGGANQGHNDSSSYRRRDPDPLTEEEFTEVRTFVQTEQKRSRRAKPVSISLMVDGAERAMAQLDDPPFHLSIVEGERVLEIKSRDDAGELLLGSVFLNQREFISSRPIQTYRLSLRGKRELCLRLMPTFDGVEIIGVDIEVIFRTRSLGNILDFRKGVGEQTPAVFRKPALALIAIGVLCTALVIGIIVIRRQEAEREYIARGEPQMGLPSLSGSPPPDSNHRDRNPSEMGKPEPKQAPDRTTETKTQSRTAPAEGTRSLPAELSQELSSLRRVHVESQSTGNDGMVGQSLLEAIAASGKLQALDEEHAEAFLLWEVKRIRGARRIEIRLLNRGGQTLWSSSRIVHVDKSDSTAAAEMVRELSAKIGP